jgi:hypothetical protein
VGHKSNILDAIHKEHATAAMTAITFSASKNQLISSLSVIEAPPFWHSLQKHPAL